MPFGNLSGWRVGSKRAVFMPAQTKARSARLASGQKKQVQRIVKANIRRNTELKFCYSGGIFSNQAIPVLGTMTKSMFTVAQGLLDTNRVGDTLMWAGSIWFRYQWIGGTVDPTNPCRVIIFQYHPVDTVAPLATDIFLPGPTGTIDVNSSYNHDNRQLYKILYDRTVTISLNGDNNHVRVITTNISLKKATKHVQYQATSTNGTNQIYMFAIAGSYSLGGVPLLSVSSKLFFRDA